MVRQTAVSRSLGKRGGWLLLVLVFLGGCGTPPSGNLPKGPEAEGGRTFVVWMLSDIQPPTKAERRLFEQAINDVNAGVAQVDMAVIAGDLLKSRSRDEAFVWFGKTRDRSKVRHWFEIAGNHDVRSEPIFSRYFPRPAAYGVEVGNLLLLLLADTEPSSATEIPDAAFGWWRDMVTGNQQRLILTVTHGQLQNSGLPASFVASRQIVGSERFEKVLRQTPVAVWASGHTHLPHGLPGTINVEEALGSTCFVNVSSIDTGPFMDSQSRFFIFREGSDKLLIRSRNHSSGSFDENLDFVLTLAHPFVFPAGEPRLILPP